MDLLRSRIVRAFPALVLGAVLLLGCGPVEYLNQVNGRAVAALAQARRDQAERYAPFEYTAANEYLQEAREKGARSAYQRAIEYGRRAQELAERAGALARERSAKQRQGTTAPSADPGAR